MPKTRAQKEAQISQIDAVLTGANSLYLVSLSGLSSNDVNKLRATLRKEGARIRVVKNRLARRAATGKPTEQLDSHFRGPTAIVYHPTDPVATRCCPDDQDMGKIVQESDDAALLQGGQLLAVVPVRARGHETMPPRA